MAIRGRPPTSGLPSGGKTKGTKNIKKMTTAEVRAAIHDDLVSVYQQLGGVAWLLKIAKEYPLEFLRQGWTRLAPPLPRENPDIVNQVNVQIENLSPIERARRVAFLLASASDRLGLPPIEHQPVRATPNWRLPEPVPAPVNVTEIAEQQKNDALVADTIDGTYSGSSSEQGFKRRNLI